MIDLHAHRGPLIRLASALPVGSHERRALIAALAQPIGREKLRALISVVVDAKHLSELLKGAYEGHDVNPDYAAELALGLQSLQHKLAVALDQGPQRGQDKLILSALSSINSALAEAKSQDWDDPREGSRHEAWSIVVKGIEAYEKLP